jgi:hypothetical protein
MVRTPIICRKIIHTLLRDRVLCRFDCSAISAALSLGHGLCYCTRAISACCHWAADTETCLGVFGLPSAGQGRYWLRFRLRLVLCLLLVLLVLVFVLVVSVVDDDRADAG